jgi:dephospho-CoA kinase
MLKIALTGGIGSGKSTVAERFARNGVPVIDADVIARDLVQPNQPAFQEILKLFGSSVLTSEGSLDRARLREIVFSDPASRRRLEAVLHPRVYAAMERQAAERDAPYVLLVVPLLVETGRTDAADRVLVVDLPEAEQVRRVCLRDGLSQSEAKAIVQAQADRAARLAVADDVIDNSGNVAFLLAQADQFHRMYLTLAQETGVSAK